MPTAQEIFNEAKRQVIGENLIFPKGRLDSIKHKLVMIFYEYSIRVSENLLTANPSSNMKSLASVTLPVPIKILERYDVEYTSVSVTGNLKDAFNNMMTQANPNTQKNLNTLSSVGSTGSALLGVALNPFNLIQLNGAKLRKHNFRWKLHPESKNETNEIEKIINTIRVNMHPKTGGVWPVSLEDVILAYPNLINFRIFGPNNPSHVFPSAPCVIDSFTVDRTGGDYPTFFAETGTPVVYQISMSVTEILPLINRNGRLDVSTVSSPDKNLGSWEP